jgi:hypothetical protein
VTANQQRAAEATGCVIEDAVGRYGPPFCATHDEDGNPPWERCRWAPVAAALDEAEARGRAEVAAKVEALANEFDGDYEIHADEVARLIRARIAEVTA